ncbi:MAG TPA: exosortase/archaeosortase family protein [Tepidisphaeraceae bacterium]|jgi:exosortase|nr:exosortase/archaeosortase family protein [Tepidisphaeraceae bacterium]
MDPHYLGITLGGWIKICSLTFLFVMLFWPNLRRLWEKTNPFNGDDNWKHGAFVPIIGLYYLYVNRDQLLAARVQTAWTGLLITLGGILFFAYGIFPGQNDWFKDIGMVITLFGLVAFMCGWQVMKTAWFPIVFLLCALPWPGTVYSWFAGPLQKLAALVAVRMLNFFGITAGQFGTKIFIEGADHAVRTLNVAEACAGLRSLMSFIAIAGAVAFLSFRPLWQKITMVFSAVPIAIFCNTMRITVQGVADRGSHLWSESFAHGFLGLAMMIPAFFLILLVGWVLENILIEEVDKRALRLTAPQGRRPVGPGRVAAVARRPDPIGRVKAAGTSPSPAAKAVKPEQGNNVNFVASDGSPAVSRNGIAPTVIPPPIDVSSAARSAAGATNSPAHRTQSALTPKAIPATPRPKEKP